MSRFLRELRLSPRVPFTHLSQTLRFDSALLSNRGSLGILERADSGGWFRCFYFPNLPAQFVVRLFLDLCLIERRGSGQQLVEQHTKAVDIRACVDVEPVLDSCRSVSPSIS